MPFEFIGELAYNNQILLSCDEMEIKNIKLCNNAKVQLCPVDTIPEDNQGKLRDSKFGINYVIDFNNNSNKLRIYCSTLGKVISILSMASYKRKWSEAKVYKIDGNRLVELTT